MNTRENLEPSSTARNFAEKAENLSNAAERVTYQMGNRIGSALDEASERTAEVTAQVRSYVKEHPLRSVTAAAAVGMFFGSLLTILRSER